jgi:ABC-type glycerol-3-phosphate transport system substrate-binding protein
MLIPPKRHILGVALLLWLVAGLVACQAQPGGVSLLSLSEPAPVVSLWHALPREQAEVLDGLVNEWARRQGNDVQVQLERSVSEEALHQKLLAAIQTETMPTLAFVRPPDIAAYADADALVPLDPLLQEGEHPLAEEELADYYPNFFEGLRYAKAGGGLYAWPVHRNQTLLFINRTRVNELGGVYPPRTWADLIRLCARHREQGGPSCMAAFPTGDVAVLWVWSHGGRVVDESGTEPAFQEKGGREVMQWLAELRALSGVYQTSSYEAKVDALSSGNTLFNFDSTASLPLYEERIGEDFELAILPPPSTTGSPVTVTTGGSVALFRTSPETQALAWDLLRFWTGPEANHQWADALGAYPVRRSVVEQLVQEWPEGSSLGQAAEWLPYARSEPLLAAWPQVEQALAQAMISVINGHEMPEAALRDAARRAHGFLQP